MYDVVVKKFTFAVSSRDELLVDFYCKQSNKNFYNRVPVTMLHLNEAVFHIFSSPCLLARWLCCHQHSIAVGDHQLQVWSTDITRGYYKHSWPDYISICVMTQSAICANHQHIVIVLPGISSAWITSAEGGQRLVDHRRQPSVISHTFNTMMVVILDPIRSQNWNNEDARLYTSFYICQSGCAQIF